MNKVCLVSNNVPEILYMTTLECQAIFAIKRFLCSNRNPGRNMIINKLLKVLRSFMGGNTF